MQQGSRVAVPTATGAPLYLLPSGLRPQTPDLGVAASCVNGHRVPAAVRTGTEGLRGDPRWVSSNFDAPPPSVPKAMRAACQDGRRRTMGGTDHLEIKCVNPRVQILEPPAKRTASARVRTS